MTIEAGPAELFTTAAHAADVPALVELVNGAYRGTPSRRGWTSEADLVGGPRIDGARLAGLIATPESAVLVLRAQAGLFACAHVAKRGEGVACLGLLGVRPALQGSGIGRRMLTAAERYACEHFGARVMELTVLSAREELIAWCERRGYAATGETRAFPRGDDSIGVPARDDLALVVMARRLES